MFCLQIEIFLWPRKPTVISSLSSPIETLTNHGHSSLPMDGGEGGTLCRYFTLKQTRGFQVEVTQGYEFLVRSFHLKWKEMQSRNRNWSVAYSPETTELFNAWAIKLKLKWWKSSKLVVLSNSPFLFKIPMLLEPSLPFHVFSNQSFFKFKS